jgi:hypothetical protein
MESFLIEGRREDILKKFDENPELQKTVEEFLDHEFNKRTNYKYVNWVLKRNFDDFGNVFIPLDIVINWLEKFDRVRKNLQYKDINQYKNIQDLIDTLEVYGDTKGEQRSKLKSGTEKIYEDNRVLVVKPLTKDASCYYGSGTRWCTASTQFHNRFDQYFKMGPLYYFIYKNMDKNNDFYKIAIHYDSKNDRMTLYDAQDKVNDNLLGLIKTLPAFKAIEEDIKKNHLYDSSQEGVNIIKKIFSEDIFNMDDGNVKKIRRVVEGKPLRISKLRPNVEATWGENPVTLTVDDLDFTFYSKNLPIFDQRPISEMVEYYEMVRNTKITNFNPSPAFILDFIFITLSFFVKESVYELIKGNDDIIYWSPKNMNSNYSFESLNPENAYIKFLNYIIEKENAGEPADKKDFLLNVLNKDPEEVNFSGYFSTMFSSMKDAGLVTIYRAKERPYFRYKIGPNYQAWKEGKLKRI